MAGHARARRSCSGTEPPWTISSTRASASITASARRDRAAASSGHGLLAGEEQLRRGAEGGGAQQGGVAIATGGVALTAERDRLTKRLAAARDNARFADKRIAALEAQIAEQLTAPPS
jgi:hypothetical protein